MLVAQEKKEEAVQQLTHINAELLQKRTNNCETICEIKSSKGAYKRQNISGLEANVLRLICTEYFSNSLSPLVWITILKSSTTVK